VNELAERPSPTSLAEQPAVRPRGLWSYAVRKLVRQPLTLGALVVLLVLLLAGALAPRLAPQGWRSIDLAPRWQNHAPILSGWHLLGTDNIGRDVLVRTLYGIHTSEQSALLAALLATLLGVAVGGLAGFKGGWLDAGLMRIADLFTAFPALMLLYTAYILLYQLFLKPVTIRTTTILFSLYLWTYVARVVRAYVASLRETEFVQAAHALGASDLRIFFRHLIPNAAGTIIVAATAVVGQVLALEATLEFFGLGVPAQIQPTLGNLIGDATATGIGPYNDLGLGWWVWATPAAALVLILICINLVGDGLDNALNPTAARR
jgi:peptide/nickel transport system permease protein